MFDHLLLNYIFHNMVFDLLFNSSTATGSSGPEWTMGPSYSRAFRVILCTLAVPMHECLGKTLVHDFHYFYSRTESFITYLYKNHLHLLNSLTFIKITYLY